MKDDSVEAGKLSEKLDFSLGSRPKMSMFRRGTDSKALVLLRGPRPIDRDCRAGDLVGRRRAQESNGSTQLLRRHECSRRLLSAKECGRRIFPADLLLGRDIGDLLLDQ